MKVFVVDDSIVARTMLIRILNEDKSIEIVGQESSGQAAIIMLEELNPDVIMIEASISGMNIMDIIKEIRKINPNIYIMLCTDYSSNKVVIPASDLGADNFINKPYEKVKVLYEMNKVKNKLGL